jgi:hypothetical protein
MISQNKKDNCVSLKIGALILKEVYSVCLVNEKRKKQKRVFAEKEFYKDTINWRFAKLYSWSFPGNLSGW